MITPPELTHKLEKYIDSIANLKLQDAVRLTVFHSGLHTTDCPGSFHFHHAYHFGLLVHTLEVAEHGGILTNALSQFLAQPIDRDVVIAATLCHDVKKVREYVIKEYASNDVLPRKSLLSHIDGHKKYAWVLSPYYDQIHHVQGSAMEFAAWAHKTGVEQPVKDAVLHAMLAHHGPVKEWGSNIEPQTPEAWTVFNADYYSAHFGKTKEVWKSSYPTT